MKIHDLIGKTNLLYSGEVLKGDLIAMDAFDGKILFDTTRNKPEYISKYMNGIILSVWADVRLIKGVGFSDYFKPVMKCYVLHNSWEDEYTEYTFADNAKDINALLENAVMEQAERLKNE